MTRMKQVGDLEINQDLKFQNREWSFERVSWITMGVILIAALLGLFGQGPLSDTTKKNGDLVVKYARFERLLASTQMLLQVGTGQASESEIQIQVDRSWLSHYNVEKIIPEPDQEALSSDKVTYTFQIDQAGQPMEIYFYLQTTQIGFPAGRIAIENGPAVNLRQLVYP